MLLSVCVTSTFWMNTVKLPCQVDSGARLPDAGLQSRVAVELRPVAGAVRPLALVSRVQPAGAAVMATPEAGQMSRRAGVKGSLSRLATCSCMVTATCSSAGMMSGSLEGKANSMRTGCTLDRKRELYSQG